jgi:putative membrane protein
LSSWETFFGIALNATLSLMLVFRLNRAATRWWVSREFWGKIIAKIRTLTSGLLTHGGHDRKNQDNAIRWLAAYALSTMEFLRGCNDLDIGIFEGILSKDEVNLLQDQRHPPLFAATQARHYFKCIFCVTADTPLALSNAWSQQLATLEEQWTIMLDCCGGMERIKATPLPIVYVSHLRTFLIFALLLYPYVWGYEWRWSTIPIVALSGFCMLGIEAASDEVEQPFKKDHVNALNMDGFCIGILSNILQMIQQQADRELLEDVAGTKRDTLRAPH